MATAFEWTPDLSIQVEAIDLQHQELFRIINGLLEAMNQNKGSEEMAKVVRFLDDYIVKHFGLEEKFMQQHYYPGYPDHKQQHTAFIADFCNLKRSLAAEGPAVHLVIEVEMRLCDWLVNHIKKIDQSMGHYLKTRM